MQTRLPKSRRAPQAIGPKKITERSIAIIETIARYRFLLARDIVRLVGGNEDVTHRHLQHLYHRDLINRFTLPAPRTGEFIYFLDNAAALRQLCDASKLKMDLFDWEEIARNRQKYGHAESHSVGRFLFIQHELMISAFHANVEIAARNDGGVEVEPWMQGAALWNSVQVSPGRILPHRPDAFLTLRFLNAPEGQQRSNFLYEADRGTSSLARIREKFEAHTCFLLQNRHVEHYRVQRLRAVLFETISDERAIQMRALAADLSRIMPAANALLWFTSVRADEGAISLNARRWLCAADDRPRSFFD